MADNKFSKETIEKYMKEMMELSKRGGNEIKLPLSSPAVEASCQSCENKIKDPDINLKDTNENTPIAKKPERDLNATQKQNAEIPEPVQTNIISDNEYIEDIDEYLKQKASLPVAREVKFDEKTEAYIEDIDEYLRQKESMLKTVSAGSFKEEAKAKFPEDIDSHLNQQAELLKAASRLPYEQRVRRENDIFVNSLNWGVPTVNPHKNMTNGNDIKEASEETAPENNEIKMQESLLPASLSDEGFLWLEVTAGNGSIPIADAIVIIYRNENDDAILYKKATTNENGEIPRVPLPAPARDMSLSPNGSVPYQVYSIDVVKDGYFTAKSDGIQVFGGVESYLPVTLIPLPAGNSEANAEIEISIPANPLTES